MPELEKELYDSLTGLYSGSAFPHIFNTQLPIAIRQQVPLSMALISIDHFCELQDTYGASCTDSVIQKLADIIKHTARDSDILIRHTSEQFSILVYDCTHIAAKEMAERLRKNIENGIRAEDRRVTVSIGISTFGEKSMLGSSVSSEQVYDEMISRANTALKRAKDTGNNKVCY